MRSARTRLSAIQGAFDGIRSCTRTQFDRPRRAKAFYGELFSWTLEDTEMPVGTYR